ncbi:aKG-HExxH-type peptide beta-hydroxylase [Bordetella muralis]|uniref:aKG-HExxH-type peptide beta-hydroxylase n=1 Tax=Bordetella muralis TaxID=1649130 RepID=UPI0039F0EF03
MISQTPLDTHLESLLAFIEKAGLDIGTVEDEQTLSTCYIEALEGLQGRKTKGRYRAANIVLDYDQASEFCRLLSDDDLTILDDKNQAQVISQEPDPLVEKKAMLLRSAIECLGVLSSEHKCLFDFLITDIFLMPSKDASGGSTSSAIGVIWANPKITHRVPDVVEFIVHELTHHAMFIDEHRYGHYDHRALMNPDSWAQSAILKVPRPLDKVIHSIVVATEIVMFREKFIGHPAAPLMHPPTPKILAQLVASVDSVEEVIGRHEHAGIASVSSRTKALLSGVRDIVESDALCKYRTR